MAGECRLNGNLGGLAIPHFPNHDDVGVLPQNGTQCIRKRQVNLRVNLNLIDAFELVFDWIFNGDDLVRLSIDLGQRSV
ncbi:hypothetical protein D3C71_1942650 [compost metagenome]